MELRELKRMYRIWSVVDLSSEKIRELIKIPVERGTYVCPTLLVLCRIVSPKEDLKDPNFDYMEKTISY